MIFCPRSRNFLTIIIVAALGFIPSTLLAASPVDLSFQQNLDDSSTELITIDIELSSHENTMNAIASSFSYPIDSLRITDISLEKSFISWWIVPPTINEALGIVDFAGVVFYPGFQGDGTLFTITFENISDNSVDLNWISHWVLASDGKGTTLPSESNDLSLFSEDHL